MDQDWLERLQQDFSFMRRDHEDEGSGIYTRWGCQCNSGWEPLLRECCRQIVDKYAEYGIGSDDIDLVPVQIKEKFGTLRFYYGYKDAPCRLAAIDNVGAGTGIRFVLGNTDDDENTGKLRHEIALIIRAAEEKSKTTCEICGLPGVLRNKRGRIETLCDACNRKHKSYSS